MYCIQYWYTADSIINQDDHKSEWIITILLTLVSLTGLLISLLFDVTALQFSLNYQHSSFLDETWIIPVMT